MNFRKKLKNIKALVFDVDGVFSREFFVIENEIFHRIMNAKDGFALKYANNKGFLTGIITGGTAEAVKERFMKLGVAEVYLGYTKKMQALNDFCTKNKLSYSDILYMGDDLPDYEVMKKVGFSACPSDAAMEIIEIAEYISEKKGGEGCVRDIIEQVMKVQEKWNVDDFKNT
ncbi:MAG: HAD hydrolase family protein [Bacteroidota bacterium]|nr:HAD hydrolase family protein [Bacteroidota bacterium]